VAIALCAVLAGGIVRRWRELRAEVAARALAEARERASEHRFATAFAVSPQPTVIVEHATARVLVANAAFEELTGHRAAALVGRTLCELELLSGRDHLAIARRLDAETSVRGVAVDLRTADGRTRQTVYSAAVVEVEGRPCVLASVTDVTEQKALAAQLEHQAFHDPLTGLANRALFRDRTTQALSRRARRDGAVAVLFLDLDDFKRVNDGLGHAAGDALLVAIATRLVAATRHADTVARLGGDEFAVLLELGADGAEASAVGERVAAAFRAPIRVDGREMSVAASVGLAVAAPGDDVDVLLRNADVAMYEAKARGKSRVVTFERAMHAQVIDRLELEADLLRALDRSEFRLLYQPIVELETGAPYGVEALVRWQHPTRGLVPPAAFIPVAEESGAIVAIGRWVLHEACAQAARWHAEARRRAPDAPPASITVNVSRRQLADPALADDVRAALAASALPPAALVLEITEGVLMEDAAQAVARLRTLRELGVRIAVDDFGTGYSSLSYLQQFPVDILKIDRTFVGGVAGGGKEAALARTIIALGDMLALTTVAEGVENAAQRAQLQALGCALGQGFLFARPLPPGDAAALFDRAAREGGAPPVSGPPASAERPDG
jgi:diguanylate cyclase (GGDEF)-like protein/PAS domain S-box-containing protein